MTATTTWVALVGLIGLGACDDKTSLAHQTPTAQRLLPIAVKLAEAAAPLCTGLIAADAAARGTNARDAPLAPSPALGTPLATDPAVVDVMFQCGDGIVASTMTLKTPRAMCDHYAETSRHGDWVYHVGGGTNAPSETIWAGSTCSGDRGAYDIEIHRMAPGNQRAAVIVSFVAK